MVAEVSPERPRFIWVYEWDLFEPLFTRNWTFSYFTPPSQDHKLALAKLVNESRVLGKWLPNLVKLPEVTSAAKGYNTK